MIVVIDTNCLLVSLPKRSETRWLYDALLNQTFQFGITTEMLEEYEEVIGRMFAPEVGYNVAQVLVERKNAILIVPYFNWSLIYADPDDNKFVDCAIACNADYLITEDRHFDQLDDIPFPKVVRVGLSSFKHILDEYVRRVQVLFLL